MRRTRAALAVIVAPAFLALTSCGIPLDDGPRPIGEPFTAGAGPDTPATPDASADSAVLFYVRSGGLVAVSDRVADTQPSTVLTTLLATRPDTGSTVNKLISQIPTGTRLLGATARGGRLQIDLSSEFEGINGPALQLAVGQIVLTVTALRDITSASFQIDGKDITVSSPSGDADEVTACDYAPLLAPPTEGAEPATTTSVDPAAPIEPERLPTSDESATSSTVAPGAPGALDAPDAEAKLRARLQSQCPAS